MKTPKISDLHNSTTGKTAKVYAPDNDGRYRVSFLSPAGPRSEYRSSDLRSVMTAATKWMNLA